MSACIGTFSEASNQFKKINIEFIYLIMIPAAFLLVLAIGLICSKLSHLKLLFSRSSREVTGNDTQTPHPALLKHFDQNCLISKNLILF